MKDGFSEFELQPLSILEGIGPARQKLLASELGILRIGDLLKHVPTRYEDRSVVHSIGSLTAFLGHVQIAGTLIRLERLGQGKAKRLSGVLQDDTGSIELVWFQSIAWVEKALSVGNRYIGYGKINHFNGKLSITHPELKVFHDSTPNIGGSEFAAMYPLTEKLKAAKIDSKTLSDLQQKALRHPNFSMPEFIPEFILQKLHLCNRSSAYKMIHFPSNMGEANAAMERLKFEEIFLFQLRSERTRLYRIAHTPGPKMTQPGTFFNAFYNNHLPFALTDAQKKVLKEIWKDLKSGVQMNRLLQGDVGSGKTIVAFIAMLLSLDNGFQSCLMAPTEILATQHFVSIQEWASPLGVSVGLLTGSTPTKKREDLFHNLKNGTLQILVGTHAVLEDPVVFHKLGLVIIDEQHRFGVAQRSRLWLKASPAPHMLVMTATPIPRTLAMTAHGESDHSIIDQLPTGRKPIITVHRNESQRTQIMLFAREEIQKGRQVYFVFPLIEESKALDLQNLMDGYDRVAYYFPTPEYRLALVHGRMKPHEKEAEMARFKSGKAHIMIATTVIEVGVNVPNASVMIIESAEHFGLSQLHQLRGRVGRGAEQSYCILMTKGKLGHTAKERMQAMTRFTDGFEIAKIDLKQRGPGDLLGTKQSGLPNFKFIDLVKDEILISLARHAAHYVFRVDPKLNNPQHQMLKKYLLQNNQDHFWSKIS